MTQGIQMQTPMKNKKTADIFNLGILKIRSTLFLPFFFFFLQISAGAKETHGYIKAHTELLSSTQLT